MMKSEIRIHEGRNPKLAFAGQRSCLAIRISGFFRISDFGFWIFIL